MHYVASSSNDAGNLTIVRKDNALVECCGDVSFPPDNRTTVTVGFIEELRFTLGRTFGSTSISGSSLSVEWLKDGAPVRTMPDNVLFTSNGQPELATTLSFTVQESDAGDYQCIFFDNISVVYYVITPIRLDTGMTLILMKLTFKSTLSHTLFCLVIY